MSASTSPPSLPREDAGFAAAVDEHADVLYALARKLCRDDVDARDLVQDAYERALRAWPSLAPGANVRAWMVTILHNLFIDRCRRARTRGRIEPIDDVQVPAEAPAAPAPWQAITGEQLAAAAAGLPDELRRVYLLHAEGRSYDELAAALGIPKSTVGTRLLRARRRLRELLEELVERP